MKFTYTFGRVVYTDKDLHYYYKQYIEAWDYYESHPNQEYAKVSVIEKYNSYYYHRNSLKQFVYEENHPSMFARAINYFGKSLGGGSDVKYSCHFERVLPYHKEVVEFVKECGKRHKADEEFVIDIYSDAQS